MPLRLDAPAFSFKTSRRLLYRGLLLLLILSLLAGTLAAQSEQETKRATAKRFFNEGVQLFNEGSKDSLEQAIQKFEEARPLFHSENDVSQEAITLNYLGFIYNALGENQKALDYYTQALLLFRAIGDRQGEAVMLNNIGKVYFDLGEKQKALDNYALALPLFRAVGDRGGEAMVLFNVAIVEGDQGKLTDARSNIEAAISIIESLRTKIANQELRASYFATVQDYYELYIDLLMRLHKQSPDAGHDSEALQTSARAHALCSKFSPKPTRIYVRVLTLC